jgi:hypothetical protein
MFTHKPWLLGIMWIYFAVGLYGACWISDEWDAWRVPFYAGVAIPLAALWGGNLCVAPSLWVQRPIWFQRLQRATVVVFLWGWILCLNALVPGGQKNLKVQDVDQTDEKQKAIVVVHHRGGLGLLYRTRW